MNKVLHSVLNEYGVVGLVLDVYQTTVGDDTYRIVITDDADNYVGAYIKRLRANSQGPFELHEDVHVFTRQKPGRMAAAIARFLRKLQLDKARWECSSADPVMKFIDDGLVSYWKQV